MKKNGKSVTELISERNNMIARREAVNILINEMIDKVQAEKRELNEAEKLEHQKLQGEFAKLTREISMNVDMVNILKQTPEVKQTQGAMLREVMSAAMNKGSKSEFVVAMREWTDGVELEDMRNGGMIPLTIKDVLPPLEMGLIFDKVGIPLETGVLGDIQWPVMGSVEATIKGEKEALEDTGIDFSNITPKKVRVGITIPVTYQAINSSSSDLLGIVQSQARMGITRLVNRVSFSHQNFTGDFHGPFAGAKASGSFAGAVPTYKELLAMKGKVAAEGVEMVGFCFVMSENMKATLEATPIDAGSGRMVVENGTINGYPVFTTEFINYGSDKSKAGVEYIAAGCFGYLAVNQYGDFRVVVDPYTRAKEDIVQVTFNSDWSMTTLRPEAFALYKTTA